MEKQPHTHGGSRPGAGRKAGDPTKTISFRVNVDLADEATATISGLNQKFVSWLERLLRKNKKHKK